MDMIRNSRQSLDTALLPYACRSVRVERIGSLADNPVRPVSGDLALAEVLSCAEHARLSLADGREQPLAVGQQIIVALGSTYAPLARSGRLPSEMGECQLLTPSGVAGVETARAASLGAAPRLRLYGLLGDERGHTLNLRDFALPPRSAKRPARSWLVISSARRTQTSPTLLHWVQGLARDAQVAVLKLTGEMDASFATRLREAGAMRVYDAADAGLAGSGGLGGPELLAAADLLLSHAAAEGARITLTRVAGGLAQPEVRALLATPGFADRFDGALLTAADALSARAAVRQLEDLGLPVLALSGSICDSPLALREAQPLPCPILPPAALGSWRAPTALALAA